jgi:hypothetical protein
MRIGLGAQCVAHRVLGRRAGVTAREDQPQPLVGDVLAVQQRVDDEVARRDGRRQLLELLPAARPTPQPVDGTASRSGNDPRPEPDALTLELRLELGVGRHLGHRSGIGDVRCLGAAGRRQVQQHMLHGAHSRMVPTPTTRRRSRMAPLPGRNAALAVRPKRSWSPVAMICFGAIGSSSCRRSSCCLHDERPAGTSTPS